MAIAMLVFVVTATLALATRYPADDAAPQDDAYAPRSVYHDVGIPLDQLGPEAQYYTYTFGGADVRFFGQLDGAGQVHVALDACDTCYSAKLGFHQDGDRMVCNSCGKDFPIDEIGTDNIPGGCWPSYVPFELKDGLVRVGTDFLDGKAYMFE
jgi:uncharacterized membrane protein